MSDTGIDWDELDRRHKIGDVQYQVVETMKAGTRAARALDHPLDRFHNNGTVPATSYDAGMKLYRDYLAAQLSPALPSYDGTPAPATYFSRSVTDRQMEASRRYEEAILAVGPRQSLVLTNIVICELTLEQHGMLVRQSRYLVLKNLNVALMALADHYKMR